MRSASSADVLPRHAVRLVPWRPFTPGGAAFAVGIVLLMVLGLRDVVLLGVTAWLIAAASAVGAWNTRAAEPRFGGDLVRVRAKAPRRGRWRLQAPRTEYLVVSRTPPRRA